MEIDAPRETTENNTIPETAESNVIESEATVQNGNADIPSDIEPNVNTETETDESKEPNPSIESVSWHTFDTLFTSSIKEKKNNNNNEISICADEYYGKYRRKGERIQ